MSSVPKSGVQKFSFSDLKSSLIKKEESTETPLKKPARAPMTRHKKRSLEPSIIIESDEDPTLEEARTKALLGVNQMFELAQKSAEQAKTEMANELAAAQEKIRDLIKIAAHREADSKVRERHWKDECKAVMEQAKDCAKIAVAEAMYHMAEEAASEGYCHRSWNVEGWAEMINKPVIKVVEREAAGEAEGDAEVEGAEKAEASGAADERMGEDGDQNAGAQ